MSEFDSGSSSLDSSMDDVSGGDAEITSDVDDSVSSDTADLDEAVETDSSAGLEGGSEIAEELGDPSENSIPEVSDEDINDIMDDPEDDPEDSFDNTDVSEIEDDIDDQPEDPVSEVSDEDINDIMDDPEDDPEDSFDNTDVSEIEDDTDDQPEDPVSEVSDEDINDIMDDPETETDADDTEAEVEDTEADHPGETELKNEPNAEITYFGRRYRTDDNGKLYMRYDDEAKNWALLPDTKYESEGYYYETNKDGSITRAGGTLRENTEGRKSLNANVDGMQEGDDRGHLIGDQFDASNRIDNLIPQASSVNRGEYKNFENTLAALCNEGHDVQVAIDPVYSDDPKRPDSLDAHLNIDGYLMDESFLNEIEQTSPKDTGDDR